MGGSGRGSGGATAWPAVFPQGATCRYRPWPATCGFPVAGQPAGWPLTVPHGGLNEGQAHAGHVRNLRQAEGHPPRVRDAGNEQAPQDPDEHQAAAGCRLRQVRQGPRPAAHLHHQDRLQEAPEAAGSRPRERPSAALRAPRPRPSGTRCASSSGPRPRPGASGPGPRRTTRRPAACRTASGTAARSIARVSWTATRTATTRDSPRATTRA